MIKRITKRGGKVTKEESGKIITFEGVDVCDLTPAELERAENYARRANSADWVTVSRRDFTEALERRRREVC